MSLSTSFQLRKLGATLNRRQTGWIGVDIGTGALKLAQVERTGSQIQIAGGAVIPFGNTRELNEENLSDDFLRRIIRTAIEVDDNFQGNTAACVVSMSCTDLRVLELPDGSDDERHSMIEEELRSDPNQRSDDLEFDFWNTSVDDGTVENNQQTLSTINVLSISRPLAEQVAHNLLTAKLRCEVLDGLPFSLARATQMVSSDRDEIVPIAALDLGHSSTTFTVTVNGMPMFTRSLKNCSIGLLMKSLSDGLGLTDMECRHLLTSHGIHSDVDYTSPNSRLDQLIFDLTSETLSHLMSELEQTVNYLQRQYQEISPQQLLLFGGGAVIRNLSDILSSKLKIPADVWSLAPKHSELRSVPAASLPLLGPAAALSALAWQS